MNAKNDRGRTPLHGASLSGNIDVVKLFIDRGVNLDIKDRDEETAIDLAIGRGHSEIIKFLLSNNNNKPDIRNILFRAIRWEDTEYLEWLLNLGIDVNHQDHFGRTMMHYAAGAFQTPYYWQPVGRKRIDEVIKFLVEKNAEVDIKDYYGLTSLHYAVIREDMGLASLFLQCGVDIHARDNAGRTPLHYTAGAGGLLRNNDRLNNVDLPGDWSSSVAELLLENGADIDGQDAIGWTPLHYATQARHKNAVRFFIDKGADLARADNRGYTPYLWAYRSFVYHENISGSGYRHYWTDGYYEILGLLRKGNYYFVAPNGNDTNFGSIDHPLKTVYAAIDIASPNDVIVIREGIYHCEYPINLDRSGEKGKPIVLKAYSAEAPVLDFSSVQETPINITGAYWHLKGLTITRGARYRCTGQYILATLIL